MTALARTPTGDIAVPLAIETDPATLTRNKLTDEFNLGQGEWQFDTTQGFPWIQQILGLKGITRTQIRALLEDAILQTPRVVSVDELQFSVNRATGALAYAFQATIDTGEQIAGGSGQPFVVTGSADA